MSDHRAGGRTGSLLPREATLRPGRQATWAPPRTWLGLRRDPDAGASRSGTHCVGATWTCGPHAAPLLEPGAAPLASMRRPAGGAWGAPLAAAGLTA